MTCSTASNSGKFVWSGVGLGEGRIFKKKTFRLYDFFAIKVYSMNPVSLLPYLVYYKNFFFVFLGASLRIRDVTTSTLTRIFYVCRAAPKQMLGQ
jgi:hypothetical protein